MCLGEGEGGESSQEIQATAIWVATKWPASSPVPVARTTPCQKQFANTRAGATIKAALVVPILSLHLRHLCLKAFSSPPSTHLVPSESCFDSLFVNAAVFSSATPSAGYVSRIPLEWIFPVPDSSLMHHMYSITLTSQCDNFNMIEYFWFPC